MSAPFPKRPPAVLMAGNDVRSIRPWLNGVRDAVASLSDFCRSLSGAAGATAHPQDPRRAFPFSIYLDLSDTSNPIRCTAGTMRIPADGFALDVSALGAGGSGLTIGKTYAVLLILAAGLSETTWTGGLSTEEVDASFEADHVGWSVGVNKGFGHVIGRVTDYGQTTQRILQDQFGAWTWDKPAYGTIFPLMASATAPKGCILCDGTAPGVDIGQKYVVGWKSGDTEGESVAASDHAHDATLTGFTATGIGSGTDFYAHTSATLTTGNQKTAIVPASVRLKYYMQL